MVKILRTNSDNTDFINLVKLLDSYLKITDGEDHDFYNQFNNIDVLQNVVVFYVNHKPVGCGAFKEFNESSVEVKRMYVVEKYRNQGIAKKVLQELESWALEIGYKKCILETGKRQTEAVQFYNKCDYNVIPNYGQYVAMENSICFEKTL
ncbi:GNAT family N-acetyltransferase [Polaribacter aquimarinus]|uniref:GNAT family N-acetyltransferase n=1 Tax=Polaribacter aquimarinus TaxID=2100726 RepID=A0A2U2JC88_9FLAO|nr:GNAT family N-acetyltransferase [Polaribacter aquimarinus]PWG05932.1 GNAT family N-acetyltransferase [Polaribacter aquimarinus]